MGVRQLSGLDAEFLAMESDVVCGHFGTVTLLDGAADLDLVRLRDLLERRLHRVPVLRQRLMGVVLGVDQPYWVDDVDFDISHHVHELVLPPPGGLDQLAQEVAVLHAQRLDRRRPLWRAHLMRGLDGGAAAVYFTIHHAVMDGVGAGALLAAIFDDTPCPDVAEAAPAWHPEPLPSSLDLLGRGGWTMTRSGLRSLRLGIDLMLRAPGTAGALVRRLPGGTRGDEEARLPLRAPRTPFNAEIGPTRSCVLFELPLSEVRLLGRRTGSTVNEVVMALCAGALRRWLADHDALPIDPLVVAVPVSERTHRESQAFGNHLALVRGPLPTHLADPLDRLHAVREGMAAVRRHGARPQGLIRDAAEYAPPLVAEAGWWVSAQVMRHVNAFNLLIANVRGPSEPRYFAGARVTAHHPVSVLVHGQGLNISVYGLGQRLCFGLLADPVLVPDLERLAEDLREELQLLIGAAAG